VAPGVRVGSGSDFVTARAGYRVLVGGGLISVVLAGRRWYRQCRPLKVDFPDQPVDKVVRDRTFSKTKIACVGFNAVAIRGPAQARVPV
jgi:hypothetical protein